MHVFVGFVRIAFVLHPCPRILPNACAHYAISHDFANMIFCQDCTGWTAEGMCHKNPRYMHFGCRKSCGTCFQPDLQVPAHGCPPT